MSTNYPVVNIEWNDVLELSSNILRQIKEQNLQIDTIVPVIRGGVPLALLLGYNLENTKTSTIHIRRSLSNTENSDFADSKLLGITNEEDITGKTILITEDIIDYGLSLDCAIENLEKLNPKKIYVATLYNFNHGKYNDVICGKKMDQQTWIVFPWERKLDQEDKKWKTR